MIMAMISRLVGAWFAFLLPCYNTFKALSHRPLSEPELERLAMFWCVIGALTAVEMSGEWLYSWFPFYWELKTIFLLFLSLPQTQGSTWIYKTYLEPYFSKNEADIDASIDAAQTQTVVFMQSKLSGLWDALSALLNRTAAARQNQGQPGQSTPSSPQPGATPGSAPHNGAPAAAPWMDTAKGLWSAYGPAVVDAVQRQVGRGAPAQGQAGAASAGPSANATSADLSSGARSPNLGQSTAFQAYPGTSGVDPRKIPLPPSDMRTPGVSSDVPPPFPTPRHY